MGNIADVSTGTAFTATVSAITDAFGDPTRRSVYLFACERSRGNDGEAPEGVTASTVAKQVGVHPNVARHHLDDTEYAIKKIKLKKNKDKEN